MMKQLHQFLDKDSHAFGALLGLVTPVIFYGILTSIVGLFPFISHAISNPGNKLMLLSIAGNLIWIRFYLVNKKAEMTGIALVSVTLLMVIVFFIFFR